MVSSFPSDFNLTVPIYRREKEEEKKGVRRGHAGSRDQEREREERERGEEDATLFANATGNSLMEDER